LLSSLPWSSLYLEGVSSGWNGGQSPTAPTKCELGGGWFPGTVEQRGKRLSEFTWKGSPQRAEGDRDTPESTEAGGHVLGPRPGEGERCNGRWGPMESRDDVEGV